MPTGYGYSNAFNVKTNPQQAINQEIEDLKFGESLRQRNQALAEARAKLFADDLQFQQGSNPFDAAIIKEENSKLVEDLGRFTTENPDWNTDRYKMAKFQEMKQSMRATPAVLRSAAYKDALAKLNTDLADVAKNPGRYNVRAYENILEQVKNYNKYGNQFGEEAARMQGPAPFVYQRPRDFVDENKLYREVGSALEPKQYEDIKNGMIGAHKISVSDKDIENEARLIYNSHPEQFDQIYGEQGIDPIKAIMAGIKPYAKQVFDIGKEDTFWKQKALIKYKKDLDEAQASGQNPYHVSILQPDAAEPGAETLAQTFGSKVAGFYMDANGKAVPMRGEDFNYYGSVFDQGYGTKQHQKNGIKQAPGYILKSLDWGQKQGYVRDPWGTTRYEVKPEFNERVRIIESPPDKDGKTTKLLQVDAIAEFNANDPLPMGKFNKQIATSKQREAVGFPENQLQQNEMPLEIIQNGYTYRLNPATGQYE